MGGVADGAHRSIIGRDEDGAPLLTIGGLCRCRAGEVRQHQRLAATR